ncbi:glycosyltransferase [Sphingomonas sp. WKB10]|nr:glycosyltransferase [Sphingomonas sp. WKB10]
MPGPADHPRHRAACREKNLAALARAYADDPALQAQANLVILAGQHAYASADERASLAELQAIADRPGMRGRIALPPQHDADDVAALYGRAARGGVFVNPALHEPFGLTLVEAAAAGVPVVATRNGGPADIVATIGHGVLIDPEDTAAIGAAIGAIVGDPTRHLASLPRRAPVQTCIAGIAMRPRPARCTASWRHHGCSPAISTTR